MYIFDYICSLWDTDFWFGSTESIFYIEIEEEYYPLYSDVLLYPIPLTLSILIFRYVLETYFFNRLGACFGLKHIKIKTPLSNPVLEKAFRKHGSHWTYKDIVGLAKQTNSSERQIERWLRTRKLYEKPSSLQRFSENCWNCFFFLNVFIYGLKSLWAKPWFWNLDLCWDSYPNQNSTADLWLYYVLSLSFYWSAIITLFFRQRQKYFWEFLYYSIAIFLLSFTWICNVFRIGAIVLLIHNATDVALSASKALKYIKQFKLYTVLFIVFLIIWAVTRLIYYPFWILHSTIFRAPIITDEVFLGYYIFKFSLLGLFFINLCWLYSVTKTLDKSLRPVAKNKPT